MSEKPDSAEGTQPVQMVGCGQCGAESGEDCRGEGTGWHLSRFDRLHDTRATPPGGQS